MNKLEVAAPDLGCVYRWNEEYKELEWAIVHLDGSYDFGGDSAGPVDEWAVGEEIVTYQGEEQTLSTVLRKVEKALGVQR